LRNGKGQAGGEMGVIEWRWKSDGIVNREDIGEGVGDERETVEEEPDCRTRERNKTVGGWNVAEIAYDIAYAEMMPQTGVDKMLLASKNRVWVNRVAGDKHTQDGCPGSRGGDVQTEGDINISRTGLGWRDHVSVLVADSKFVGGLLIEIGERGRKGK